MVSSERSIPRVCLRHGNLWFKMTRLFRGTVEHEEFLEQAELFALGVLEGDELRQFEVHLASGCTFCQAKVKESTAALDQFAFSLEPTTPPAEPQDPAP